MPTTDIYAIRRKIIGVLLQGARLKAGRNKKECAEVIGVTPNLNDVAFKLSENNRYPDAVLENEDGALVIRWEGEERIDKEKYKQEKGQYADSQMLLKRLSLYDTWLKRLKDQADIDRSKFEKYK